MKTNKTPIQTLRNFVKNGKMKNLYQGYNSTEIGGVTVKSCSNGVVVEFENKSYHIVDGKVSRI